MWFSAPNVAAAQYNYEEVHPKIPVYKLALYPHNQEQKLKPNCPAQSHFVESTANTNKTTKRRKYCDI
jgi:hypothetical protein